MVEKQVNVKIITAHFQMNLPSYKGKALPQFKQELLYMFRQLAFDFYFSPRSIRA